MGENREEGWGRSREEGWSQDQRGKHMYKQLLEPFHLQWHM